MIVTNGRRLRLGEALTASVRGLVEAWRWAWGAIAACALVWAVRPFVAGDFGWIWSAAALIATLVLVGALARTAISDDRDAARRLGLGPAGLQLGWPELRLLGAALLCAVFLAMILSVVALVLLAVFGMAGLNAEAIRLRDWGAVGPIWKLALLAVVTLSAFYALAVLAVRLSLFAPATLGRGHMVSLNSMGIAQGSFWPLLGGLAVVGLPMLGLVILTGAGMVSGVVGWIVWVAMIFAVEAPLSLAFLGAAYRRLEYWTPQGATHD